MTEKRYEMPVSEIIELYPTETITCSDGNGENDLPEIPIEEEE